MLPRWRQGLERGRVSTVVKSEDLLLMRLPSRLLRVNNASAIDPQAARMFLEFVPKTSHGDYDESTHRCADVPR